MGDTTTMRPSTMIRDAILANRDADQSPELVDAVEWAAVEDTGAAIRDARHFPNFDEYMASYEVCQ